MKKTKPNFRHMMDALFILSISAMFIVYYIVYRTDSREAWNLESYRQVEILISTIRDILLGR